MEQVRRHQSADSALAVSFAQIKRAKQEWEVTVDAIPQLVCLIDAQGRILRANRTLERWGLGQVTNVKGRRVHAVLHPTCAAPGCPLECFWRQAWQDIAHGHTAVWEAEDAALARYLHVEVRPLGPHPGKVGGGHSSTAIVIVHDITQIKRLEAIQRASEQQYRQHNQELLSLVNQLRIGVVTLDAAGQVTFLNEAGQRWLGKTLEEVVDKPWHQVLPFSSVDIAALEGLATLPLQRPLQFATRLVGHNGRPYWVDVNAQADPHCPQRTLLFLYDRSEVYDLRRLLNGQAHCHDLVGTSPPMLHLYQLLRTMAPTDLTVLIEGETGTGKELVARALHALSPRRNHPFLALHCAEWSDALLSSQLFGHKRGAFTDAIADHPGLFEAAQGGTLLLDEVGDIPLAMQTSLLRVLQEREVTRLGETKPRKINIRILAATQHDLAAAVARGRFRADLLYRLRVGRLTLPALRERREDIPLLVQTFLAHSRGALGPPPET